MFFSDVNLHVTFLQLGGCEKILEVLQDYTSVLKTTENQLAVSIIYTNSGFPLR